MRTWKRKVAFRDLLSDDGSAANAIRVGKLIAARVALAVPEDDPLRDDELTELIQGFRQVVDCDELNDCLNDLYDWGDHNNRLWVECAFEWNEL